MLMINQGPVSYGILQPKLYALIIEKRVFGINKSLVTTFPDVYL